MVLLACLGQVANSAYHASLDLHNVWLMVPIAGSVMQWIGRSSAAIRVPMQGERRASSIPLCSGRVTQRNASAADDITWLEKYNTRGLESVAHFRRCCRRYHARIVQLTFESTQGDKRDPRLFGEFSLAHSEQRSGSF